MGWSSGHEVFNAVAHQLSQEGVPDETRRRVLGVLIDGLRDRDWDSEDESLEEFRDDPLIVKLFAERGVTADCGDQGGPAHTAECSRYLGHDGDHVDDQDYSWPPAAKEA